MLGCAAVKPLGRNAAGEALAEFSAFCVHPTFRGSGKGDSFLEYLGGSFPMCLQYSYNSWCRAISLVPPASESRCTSNSGTHGRFDLEALQTSLRACGREPGYGGGVEA